MKKNLSLTVRAAMMMPMVIGCFVWIRSSVLAAISVLPNLISCKTATRANSAANERPLAAARKATDQRSADSATADDLCGSVVITVRARILTGAVLPQGGDRAQQKAARNHTRDWSILPKRHHQIIPPTESMKACRGSLAQELRWRSEPSRA